jgi:hypothetical protein
MICPKCDEKAIRKIQFKKSGIYAFVCDVCKSLWFAKNVIDASNATSYDLYTQNDDYEYMYEDVDDDVQDKRKIYKDTTLC